MLRSLKHRTLGEVLWRARAGGYQWLEGRGFGLAGLSDRDILADWSANDLREQLRARWPRTSVDIPSSEGERLRAIADDACEGRFRLLGYRFLDFGRPVDWHLDPVHRRRAPVRHWSRIPYLDATAVGDHKIIWELNRQQFLATLGQVYALTGDARYATAAAGYLEDWIAANPPSRGINWCSSLEVGFRAIAWLWCLRHIVHAEALSAAQCERVLATLVRHGLHVERYLSRYFSPNTHLTGEALALLYLGTLLPESRTTARWTDTGLAILEAELQRQVWDDGVYFEKSTWYQRYTVDFYLHATVLRELAGRPTPEWWKQRVTAAANVLAALVRPDGTIPLIGDDDGGCLLNLESAEVTDIRPTLALAGKVLGLAVPESVRPSSPTVSWILGLGHRESASAPARPGQPVTAFPQGGLYVFRDQRRESTTLVVDAGSMGRYGHAHAGCLGFDLSIGSTPVITDPGTCSYVGPERAEFRSGAAHSTVTLAGEGSAMPEGPFGWRGRPVVETRAWESGGNVARLTAAQRGWSASRKGEATHERTIIWLEEGCWVVCDRISDSVARTIGIELQAGNQVRANLVSDGEAAFQTTGSEMLHLAVAASSPVTIHLEDGAVSPCYGIHARAQRVGITVKPTSSGQDTMVLLAFARDPVTVKRAAWEAERQTLTAVFSNGAHVQLGMRDEELGWTVDRRPVGACA